MPKMISTPTLENLEEFLAQHRAVFGLARMEGGGDGGDGGASGDGAGDGDGGDGDGGDGGDAGGKKDDPPAEPPALVEERTARKNAVNLLAELVPSLSKAQIAKALKSGDVDSLRPKNDNGGKDDSKVDEAAIRREVTEKANARIVSAEVRALAADLFEDPADAPLYLDLSKYDVDDDGNVDAAEIKADLKKVLDAKKHLAKKATRPKPDPSQGKGGGDAEVGFGRSRIRHAYATTGK